MSYRQMIAPLRSDGSDFHRAPNHLGKLVTGLRCSLCGWLTHGVVMNGHRRREDGKGWESIDSHGLIIFDPAPLISEEQAIDLIKQVKGQSTLRVSELRQMGRASGLLSGRRRSRQPVGMSSLPGSREGLA